MNYRKVLTDYKELFPKRHYDIIDNPKWGEWQHQNVNGVRFPHMNDSLDISIKYGIVKIKCRLWFDSRVQGKTFISCIDVNRVINCVDFYSDEFIIDNDSIKRVFSFVRYLESNRSLLMTKEWLKIKSIASQIVKYVKNKQQKVKKINESNKKRQTYLMKDSNTGLYKIGFSNNPRVREKTLQGEKPTINMVKVWNKNIERKLHNIYDNQRIRGEWFELNKIQVRYICTHY